MTQNHFFASVSTGIPGGVIPPSDGNIGICIGKIPELGSNHSAPPAKRTRSGKLELAEIVNPPYTCWTYTDHESNTDFVCVAINIFSGSKTMNFDVSEDGMNIIAKFSWPMAMHNPTIMFAEELLDKTVSIHHPMIHAMSSSMFHHTR